MEGTGVQVEISGTGGEAGDGLILDLLDGGAESVQKTVNY